MKKKACHHITRFIGYDKYARSFSRCCKCGKEGLTLEDWTEPQEVQP